MFRTIAVVFLICLCSSTTSERCELLTIPICKGLGYNMTRFPNSLGHKSLTNAGLEVTTYSPLVKINCSPHLKLFLCSLYLPVCTILEAPVPPCREVCESARDGCSDLMRRFGHEWPEHMNCDRFPSAPNLCVSSNWTSSHATSTPAVLNETITASPPVDTSDGEMAEGKRVNFEVDYRVNCSTFNRDRSMQSVAREVALANINHLQDICSRVCQVNQDLRMRCRGDTLTITYPTSLEYPLATKSVDRRVKKALWRNIRRKGTMMLMVLPGHTPVAQFPLGGRRDSPVSVILQRFG